MSRTYQRLRIDSKFRAPQSQSGSDFIYQLPENLECQSETIAFISGLTFPFAMRTIEEGYNDRLYYRIFYAQQATDQWLTIPPNNYDGFTFAAMLQQQLNAIWGPIPEDSLRPTWTVQFNVGLGCLLIQWGTTAPPDSPDRSFEIVSEYALMNRSWDWHGPPYDPANPLSCGNVLRIEADPHTVVDNAPFFTGTFDAQADWHVVYLASDLCSYQSVGRPETSSAGFLSRSPMDRLSTTSRPGAVLKSSRSPRPRSGRLNFRLVDDRNRTVPLHGNDMSLELYFTSNPLYSNSYPQ